MSYGHFLTQILNAFFLGHPVQKVAIKLQALAVLWPHQVEFLFAILYSLWLQTSKSDHRTARVCSFMATFYRLRKVAIKLPGFAVLW